MPHRIFDIDFVTYCMPKWRYWVKWNIPPIANRGSGSVGLISLSKSLTLSSIWNPWIDADTLKQIRLSCLFSVESTWYQTHLVIAPFTTSGDWVNWNRIVFVLRIRRMSKRPDTRMTTYCMISTKEVCNIGQPKHWKTIASTDCPTYYRLQISRAFVRISPLEPQGHNAPNTKKTWDW